MYGDDCRFNPYWLVMRRFFVLSLDLLVPPLALLALLNAGEDAFICGQLVKA